MLFYCCCKALSELCSQRYKFHGLQDVRKQQIPTCGSLCWWGTFYVELEKHQLCHWEFHILTIFLKKKTQHFT